MLASPLVGRFPAKSPLNSGIHFSRLQRFCSALTGLAVLLHATASVLASALLRPSFWGLGYQPRLTPLVSPGIIPPLVFHLIKHSRSRVPCGKVTGLLRTRILFAIVLSALAGVLPERVGTAAPPVSGQKSTIKLLAAPQPAAETRRIANADLEDDPPTQFDNLPELFPYAAPPQSADDPQGDDQPSQRLEDYESQAQIEGGPPCESNSYYSKPGWLGFKHSSTDGRNAGIGVPLMGTSWLNRPYYVGADIGAVWVTRPIETHITTDTDFYGGIYAGYDWDYYWGTELALQRGTPELINEEVRDAPRGDRMWIWNANLMYYPWGDSMYRPYWRFGIGGMEIDFPTDRGYRQDETLWNFPIGIGIKYPVRRWLVARTEIVDQIGIGNSGVNSQHDITLTFGLEWRLGAHPRSYWPWNPSRHIW